jgi:hypothetical protein
MIDLSCPLACVAAIPLPLIVLDLRLSTTAKLLAVALPTAIHLVIGNFIEPKVRHMRGTLRYLSFGPIEKYYVFVTSACIRRTGVASQAF